MNSREEDGYFLHFLKNCPAWYVLVMVLIMTTIIYWVTKDVFFQRVFDNLTGAIIAVLTGRWLMTQQPNGNPYFPTQQENKAEGDMIINNPPIKPAINEPSKPVNEDEPELETSLDDSNKMFGTDLIEKKEEKH